MIRLRQLTLRRGTRVILDQANLVINPGEHLALIGHNGSGKSTLLAALAGELAPDHGDIQHGPHRRIVTLEQNLPQSDDPAWHFVLSADRSLMHAHAQLASAVARQDDTAIALAHDELEQLGAAAAPARARALLHGLGFSSERVEQPVNTLSGGWRMRLNLARALMVPCDLLLLDEPTNHLDIDAIIWLERQISRHPATVLVVSHDRDFLDHTAHNTLHLEHGTLTRYAGGYSACEHARAERASQQGKLRVTQQQQRAKLQGFVERFRAKASKARQAQSRLKALERMEVLAPLRATQAISFSFAQVGDGPDPLINLDQVSVGYTHASPDPPGFPSTARPIVKHVNLTIRPGSRLGILGRNGAGKTTLIRTIVDELPALSGVISRARGLRIGYFAQEQVDALRPEDSAFMHMQRLAPQERDQTLRNWLAQFAFQGEDATRPVGPMSGGERARLALAMLVWGRPHVLILDEPTNHLDAPTRDALADALAEFDGALLLVSHDRYILRHTVDELLRISDQHMSPFDGDLEDYAKWLLKSPTAADGAPTPQPSSPPPQRREERRAAAAHRARQAAQRKPLIQALNQVEARIKDLETRMAGIDAELAQPETYTLGVHTTDLVRQRTALHDEHSALEERWLALSADLDTLDEAALCENITPASKAPKLD